MAWQRSVVTFSLSLAVGGLIGFFCANNLSPASSVAPPTVAAPASSPAPTLTLEEIKNAVALADAQATDIADIALQRKLGLGLYQYARQTPNATYLNDLLRLLERARNSNPQDREVVFALGNIMFALGRRGETARFAGARKHYASILATQPDDTDARTALGLAYYFDRPPQTAPALAEWRRVLQANPKHEGALQSLASALLESGQRDEAAQIINQLAQVNPQHPALADFQARLSP